MDSTTFATFFARGAVEVARDLIGITLLVIGTTIWWVWSALGFVIAAVSIGLWVRDVRHDVDALPEEHHHH